MTTSVLNSIRDDPSNRHGMQPDRIQPFVSCVKLASEPMHPKLLIRSPKNHCRRFTLIDVKQSRKAISIFPALLGFGPDASQR